MFTINNYVDSAKATALVNDIQEGLNQVPQVVLDVLKDKGSIPEFMVVLEDDRCITVFFNDEELYCAPTYAEDYKHDWSKIWEKIAAWYLESNPFPMEWESLITYSWGTNWVHGSGLNPKFQGKVTEDYIIVTVDQYSWGTNKNYVVQPKILAEQKELIKSTSFAGVTLAKLSKGVEVKSGIQIKKDAEEEAAIKELENLEKAQTYVGWSIVKIDLGCITIESPDKTQTTTITHGHTVWNYGDDSESWLNLGDLTL